LFHRAPLTIDQILAWADDYHRRTGKWPHKNSGCVKEAPAETWQRLNAALLSGRRGLPGGRTLAQWLACRRGVRNKQRIPKFTEDQILRWARAYHRRTKAWPTRDSGSIPEAPGETWSTVASAMHAGDRGMSSKIPLAGLLVKHFGVRRAFHLPKLTLKQILGWAKAHRDRTGSWPKATSGAIVEAPGETWSEMDHALSRGRRGLPRGLTLARLFKGLGVKGTGWRTAPPLTEKWIVLWARAYCRRTGEWPDQYCGRIADAAGEVWYEKDQALRKGARGLPGGSSLKALLAGERKPKPLVPGRTALGAQPRGTAQRASAPAATTT
jgi:hypothetical protein